MRKSSRALVLLWIGIGILAATSAKFKRPKCNSNEFMCDNQERCIHLFNKCDGIKDCPDGSDETLASCWAFGQSCGVTQPNAFKCAYGACIDGFKECDRNKFDCADNSDEEHCPTDPPDVTSRCQSSEFTCKSGQCISLNDVCDGEPNCDDKSDETIAQCAVMRCSPFSFQCAYGACIDWNKRCNGREDCVGGSDEAPDLCNRPVDAPEDANINKGGDSNSTDKTCPFPTDEHTIYTLGCKGATCQDKVPGSPVPKNVAVVASCPPGYALPLKYERQNYMICLKPPDFHRTIKCDKICPPLVSNYHDLECKFKGKKVPCERPMHPGTVAHLECKSHFKPQSDIKAVTQTQCQPDGTWLDDLYKCIPEETGEAETTTANPLGSRVGTPQTYRLTRRMIACLALYDAGLLIKAPVRATTTPPPTYVFLVGISRPNRITVASLGRVKRDTMIAQYQTIVSELSTYVRFIRHPPRPVDGQVRSIPSIIIELLSLFPGDYAPSQFYDSMELVRGEQHLQKGLSTCSLIDEDALVAIIDHLDRKIRPE